MKRKRALSLIILAAVGELTLRQEFYRRWTASVRLNEGIVGGAFSSASHVLRFGFPIGYYFGFAVLLGYYWKGLFRMPSRFFYGVVCFFAGLSGNFLERLLRGGVVDYLSIPRTPLVINGSDLLETMGLLLLAIETFHALKRNPAQTDRRTRIFADQRIQIRIFLQVSAAFTAFLAATILLLASAYGLTPSLLLLFLSYGFLFEVMLFCILVSGIQRIVGPVRAFIRFMLIGEKQRAFKLRENDEFRELEKIVGTYFNDG